MSSNPSAPASWDAAGYTVTTPAEIAKSVKALGFDDLGDWGRFMEWVTCDFPVALSALTLCPIAEAADTVEMHREYLAEVWRLANSIASTAMDALTAEDGALTRRTIQEIADVPRYILAIAKLPAAVTQPHELARMAAPETVAAEAVCGLVAW